MSNLSLNKQDWGCQEKFIYLIRSKKEAYHKKEHTKCSTRGKLFAVSLNRNQVIPFQKRETLASRSERFFFNDSKLSINKISLFYFYLLECPIITRLTLSIEAILRWEKDAVTLELSGIQKSKTRSMND